MRMASRRAISWFSIFVFMSMVVSLPFVQSSRNCCQGRRITMAENITTIVTEDPETNMVNRFAEKNAAPGSSASIKDSNRVVPTGPDPLHHHHNPTTSP